MALPCVSLGLPCADAVEGKSVSETAQATEETALL